VVEGELVPELDTGIDEPGVLLAGTEEPGTEEPGTLLAGTDEVSTGELVEAVTGTDEPGSLLAGTEVWCPELDEGEPDVAVIDEGLAPELEGIPEEAGIDEIPAPEVDGDPDVTGAEEAGTEPVADPDGADDDADGFGGVSGVQGFVEMRSLASYTFNRLRPPQETDRSPLQGILHSEEETCLVPCAR
jgi:hypothetical protein